MVICRQRKENVAICSYLVIAAEGAADTLEARLGALPGCDVARAVNRDVLVLVTDTASAAEEFALREELDRLDGIRALILTFGELDPDAPAPAASPRPPGRRRGLPVLGPAGLRGFIDDATDAAGRDQ